jgi:predicted nucleotidyltransferase
VSFQESKPPDWYWRIGQCDKEFLKGLLHRGVNFLIIGGTAVCFHGCRSVFDVDDLDLLIRPTLQDAKLVAETVDQVMLSCGISTSQIDVARLSKPKCQMPVKHTVFNTEFLTANSTQEFDLFFSRAFNTSFDLLSVKIIAIHDLIAMKQVAISQQDALQKHGTDLQNLRNVIL